MTLQPGTETNANIEDLAFGGRGVARVEGLVCFVEGGLPGETVRIRVSRLRKSFAEAEVVEVLIPSADRIVPPCRHYRLCGGCDLQHLKPASQARAKERQVGEILRRIAGLESLEVAPCVLAPSPFAYRFRMDYDWRPTPQGAPVLGLHRRGRPDTLVPIEQCLLTSQAMNDMLTWLPREAARMRLQAFDPRRSRGLLRRTSFQQAGGTGEILVTLETGRGDPPALKELAVALVRRFPRTVGVVRREHHRDGGRVELSILAGRDFLHEEVDGDRFKIPAEAFFQPNPAGSAVLRREAIRALAPAGNGTVLELFSGVGFFTLAVARAAHEVVAVEASPVASVAARDNASAAGLSNCQFVTRDVAAALSDLAGRTWDAVLLDPPRTGLTRDAARLLARCGSPRIVYVSCDPATLARDLAILSQQGGYIVRRLTPFDLFPQTHHIECVAELQSDSPT